MTPAVSGSVSAISRTHFFATCDGQRMILNVFFPFLRLIRGQRRCTDLRFAASTLCHDERRLSLRELALDRFRNRKLRRVKAVARVCADIVVDAQNLRGKLLRSGVKQRLELIPDSFRDSHTERGQIAGDGMDVVKAVWVLNRSGDADRTAFEAVHQYLDDIGIVLLAQQQPRLQPFPDGDDAQRLEKSAPLQFVQNIVLKLRDKRHSRFSDPALQTAPAGLRPDKKRTHFRGGSSTFVCPSTCASSSSFAAVSSSSSERMVASA